MRDLCDSLLRRARLGAALCWLATAGGCAVGPDYHAPDVPVPERYGESTTRLATAVDLARWWTTFQDETLASLIDRAVESNLDLHLAAARVREARAARGGARAEFWPNVDATGAYTRQRASQNAFGTGSFARTDLETDLWQVGFDSTWEIDVFGGVRRSIEAANADLQASIEGHRDVLVTLLGDVAQSYVELREAQRRLAITRANLESQRETLELTRVRFNAGLVGELDVARAQALVAATSSQVPALEQQVRASIHRLSVLLGQPPSALADELGPEGPIPSGVAAVPVGLPSELLRRRPDIRRAERNAAAATARVGVATADLFPRFTLTGSYGWQSEQFDDLLESDSVFWNVGPGVRWNLLDFGRTRSAIEVQNARQEQALVQYEQAVLTALEEVENAIVAYDHEQTRRVSLASAVDSNRRAVELASELYSRGLVDFLNVQEAQRSLLIAEDQLVQSDAQVSTNLVALYKALGGGWDPDAAERD